MKRFVPLSLLLLTLLGSANAIAQPAQPRPGGGGRDFEDRRAQRQERQEFRREQQERRAEPGQGQGAQERREPERQRMSPEERRALRDQIRDHGREIYHPPHRR